MKLLKPKHVSKKTVVIICIVCGVLLVAGFGWWLFTNKVVTDYRDQVSSAVAAIKKDISDQAAPFEAIVKEGDSVKSSEALQKLEDSLQKRIAELPATPSALGVNITPQQDAQRRDDLIKALQALGNDLRNSRELLVYGHTTIAILQDLTTKTGANADQQKALAEAWQAAVNKLRATTPPSSAETVHQQIIQAAAKVQAGLVSLPDLFTKKDIPGFNAKQKEIEGAIAELRNVGPGVTDLFVGQDKNIGQSYQNLRKLL